MRAILAANVLVAALGAGPNFAAADEKACPIARVVARVQSVAGDAQKAESNALQPATWSRRRLARAFSMAIGLKLAPKRS